MMSSITHPVADGGPGFKRIALWIGALGLLIRLIYFSEHAASPFFNVTVLDEKYYDGVARALVEAGSVAEINPGFRPLLYPFFLAFFHLAFDGWATVAAIAAQHLLGIATAVLVAAMALGLFRRPGAGLAAGALYLLAGPPLFFEGEVLITSLFTFLVTVLLVALQRLCRDSALLPWFLAGLLVAVAAEARPNILVFLAAFPLMASTGRKRGQRTLSALAGALAGLFVFALVRAPLTGHFNLLGGSGGVNFYLGNKQGADGRVPRQDYPVTYGAEYRDSVQVFAEEAYREETGDASRRIPPGRISRYWLLRGVDEIRADPASWLGLMTRKVAFLAWNHEIPNNKSFAFVRRHESVLLRFLPVGWWLLLALAPLGAALAWHSGERRFLLWIVCFGGCYAAGVVLFFVTSRYRIPLWPAMSVLAGGGVLALTDALRERDVRALSRRAAVAVAVALVSLVNWFAVPVPSYARDYFFRSIAQLEKGRLEDAEADARRSVELDPTEVTALFQLGTVELALGRHRRALESYRSAALILPGEPRIWNNLGVTLERLGRHAEAYRFYLRSSHLGPDYPPPLANSALLDLRAGRLDKAESKIRQAEALGYDEVSLLCARAFLDRDRGYADRARRKLAAAAARDAEVVRLLVEENQQPLSLEMRQP